MEWDSAFREDTCALGVLASCPGAYIPWGELGPRLCQGSPSNVCMPRLPPGVGSGTYKCLRKKEISIIIQLQHRVFPDGTHSTPIQVRVWSVCYCVCCGGAVSTRENAGWLPVLRAPHAARRTLPSGEAAPHSRLTYPSGQGQKRWPRS